MEEGGRKIEMRGSEMTNVNPFPAQKIQILSLTFEGVSNCTDCNILPMHWSTLWTWNMEVLTP